MEEAYKAGKVRAIGLSNFYPDRYIDIYHFAEIKPAVNQVETYVFQQQKIAKEYMKKTARRLSHRDHLQKEKMITLIILFLRRLV